MAAGPRPIEGVHLNQYEVAVLYHPDLEIDLDKAESRVTKIMADNGGKITKTDNWGKRKLAYPINKQDFAVYVFYTAEIPAENVSKIEQTFNITDEIIRFLITKPDLKAMQKAEALRAEKAKKAAERGDREDDEEPEEETERRPRRASRIEE
jgi:small subunit ribosomal protein S6